METSQCKVTPSRRSFTHPYRSPYRFLNILYNAEAYNFDGQSLVQSHGINAELQKGTDLFLNPLSFDEEVVDFRVSSSWLPVFRRHLLY
jgi:hypothetical protein